MLVGLHHFEAVSWNKGSFPGSRLGGASGSIMAGWQIPGEIPF